MFFGQEELLSFNRFDNLDGAEDKLIYYLLSEKDKTPEQLFYVHTLWRLLYYEDIKALINDKLHPLPTYKQIEKLICNDETLQSPYRIFRMPYVAETEEEQGAVLRVFVERIIPDNHLIAQVNFGVDILVHSKLTNILNPITDDNDEVINVNELKPLVQYKNRATTMLKCVLALLNGAYISGIGNLIFSREPNRFVESKLGLMNNRSTYGYRTIFTCQMSGVS